MGTIIEVSNRFVFVRTDNKTAEKNPVFDKVKINIKDYDVFVIINYSIFYSDPFDEGKLLRISKKRGINYLIKFKKHQKNYLPFD